MPGREPAIAFAPRRQKGKFKHRAGSVLSLMQGKGATVAGGGAAHEAQAVAVARAS